MLTGGLLRDYYFDKYLFETRPAILRRLGRFLAGLVSRDTYRLAALERRERFRVLWSGATHDAAHVARVAPTGLLFVLSREGLSHTPEEWSRVDDIACGTEVMAAALVALDEEAK